MMKKLFLLFSLGAISCGDGTVGNGDDAGGIAPTPVAVYVTPEDVTLQVRNGGDAIQSFTAMAEYEDGSTLDVTDSASFSVDVTPLGSFQGPEFSASGVAAGRGQVTALVAGISGQTSLTVQISDAVVVEPAPGDAPDLFESAIDDPARAPGLVYPSDGTMVPPNLGDFDVHWNAGADNDLYEVTLSSEFVDLRTYVTGTPGAAAWLIVAPELWAIAAASNTADALIVSVRGMSSAAPESAGSSENIAVTVMDQTVDGGIYYWASNSIDGPGGIYRHDMGAIGQPAEQFYTTDESVSNRCVACHALSRDGTRMALTFDGGNGEATVLDVATREPLLPIGAGLAWNFATFEPGAERVLTVSGGSLTLRDLEGGGAVVATVPTSGYATHPDFRPQGDAIAYALTPAPGQDWHFGGGAIVTQSFDPLALTFGDPVVLVPDGGNNYYPSWSPDGEWIMFNRSTEDAYDDASAELYAVKADGTGEPLLLSSPNVTTGMTNSWARWAPFSQEHNGQRYYWFTFSSKRNFGVRLVGANRPQVWMAPFFPDRVAAGDDPSAPAFRLPAQDLTGSNHIAQWTEEVVPIE